MVLNKISEVEDVAEETGSGCETRVADIVKLPEEFSAVAIAGDSM
jgi:hypothetical protein